MLAAIKDWFHERRIRRLRDEMVRNPCNETWEAFRDAIRARSALQVARMERDRGLA